jgi:hypothetical protein
LEVSFLLLLPQEDKAILEVNIQEFLLQEEPLRHKLVTNLQVHFCHSVWLSFQEHSLDGSHRKSGSNQFQRLNCSMTDITLQIVILNMKIWTY